MATIDYGSDLAMGRKARRLSAIIVITIAVVLLAYVLYRPHSPAVVQERNMRAADAFIPTIRAALGGDERFKDVTINSYTGEGGSLRIGGVVRPGDLRELRRRVDATAPPVAVSWWVEEWAEQPSSQPSN